jgi:predicted metal-dependent enzyme (double-stranded beta helix superfamily)
VTEFSHVVDEPEERLIATGATLLGELVATDDWLNDAYAAPDPTRYRQYLLHRNAAASFCVVSFVWGPGQSTPIHDHGTWGLIGVLRGAEISTRFELGRDGLEQYGPETRLERGQVDAVSPTLGDIHQVTNALADAPSISIHVYGGDIGTIRRHTYTLDGTPSPFVSRYANAVPAGAFTTA